MGEDTSKCNDLRVVYLDQSTSSHPHPFFLDLEYDGERNCWTVKGQNKTLNVDEIKEYVAELIGCEPSTFDCAPLWLPCKLQDFYKVLKSLRFENWFLRP